MNWFPRIGLFGCTTAVGFEDGDDYDGRTLIVAWLGWVLEITLARHRS